MSHEHDRHHNQELAIDIGEVGAARMEHTKPADKYNEPGSWVEQHSHWDDSAHQEPHCSHLSELERRHIGDIARHHRAERTGIQANKEVA